jgi:PEP-CTERM motif
MRSRNTRLMCLISALRPFVAMIRRSVDSAELARIPSGAVRRSITFQSRRMSRILCAVVFIGGLCGSTAELRAQTTLGFDTLPPTATFGVVPNGYGGLNWNNFDYVNHSYLPGTGYDHGTTSLPNAGFNMSGDVASIVDPSGFLNFDSAELTAAFVPNLQVVVDGFNTNVSALPMFTTTVTLSTATPTLFAFDSGGAFKGVNQIRFTPTSGAGPEFAIDDFKFTTTETGARAPEPGSFALAGLGFAGLLLGARRRRQSRRTE